MLHSTSGPMKHYMSQTKNHYSGLSPLKSHPDSVVAISGHLSQYLIIMQPKHTSTQSVRTSPTQARTHTPACTHTHAHTLIHTRARIKS